MVSTMFIYFEPDNSDDMLDGGFVDAGADTTPTANGDAPIGRHRARSNASAASTGTTADMKAESSVPRRWPLAALRSVQVCCGLGCTVRSTNASRLTRVGDDAPCACARQPRRYLLRPNALELYFITGDSVFLAFRSKRIRRKAVNKVCRRCIGAPLPHIPPRDRVRPPVVTDAQATNPEL